MTAEPKFVFRGDKSLIPARREAGQLRLDELQLVNDLSGVVAGLRGLAEGEALGFEVIGHVRIINRGVVNDRFTVSAPS